LFVRVGAGDDRADDCRGGVIGLVRRTGWDVDEVARLHAHDKIEVGAVAHFGNSFEHENRRFVGLMVMGLGADPGRNLEQMHADPLGTRGLRRYAGQVVEALLPVESLAASNQLALRHGPESYDLSTGPRSPTKQSLASFRNTGPGERLYCGRGSVRFHRDSQEALHGVYKLALGCIADQVDRLLLLVHDGADVVIARADETPHRL